MHDDFHHAVAQRANLLDDQLDPFQILIPACWHAMLNFYHFINDWNSRY